MRVAFEIVTVFVEWLSVVANASLDEYRSSSCDMREDVVVVTRDTVSCDL
jgi:hypothetical protein